MVKKTGIKRNLIKLSKPLIECFPEVARTYRYIRDSRQISQKPKSTPMGFKFVGRKSMEEGSYEPEITKMVKNLLPKTDVFINVGANIGYYCCIALSFGKHTVAFEPVELNLKYLYKNIKANHWENKIEVFPLALSDKVGIIELYGGATGASLIKGWAGISEQYTRLIPTFTMDIVLASRFQDKRCLVLIDIEGEEKYMLQGAKRFLDYDEKPIWIVEISITEHQPCGYMVNPNLFSTFQIFWDNGYEAMTIDRHTRLVDPNEIKAICKSGKDSLHTHNFLFIEKGKKSELLRS